MPLHGEEESRAAGSGKPRTGRTVICVARGGGSGSFCAAARRFSLRSSSPSFFVSYSSNAFIEASNLEVVS